MAKNENAVSIEVLSIAEAAGLTDAEVNKLLKSPKLRIKDRTTEKRYSVDALAGQQSIAGALVALASVKGADGIKVSLPKIEGRALDVTQSGKTSAVIALAQCGTHEGFSVEQLETIQGVAQFGSPENYAAHLASVKAEKEAKEKAAREEQERIVKEAQEKAEKEAQRVKNGQQRGAAVPSK